MKRSISLIIILQLHILIATGTCAKSQSSLGVNEKGRLPIITLTHLDINDNALNLSYDIRNETKQHLWIFQGLGRTDVSADVLIDKYDRTLLIRSRLGVPIPGGVNVSAGRYVLMRAGETQKESLSLKIPFNIENGFTRKRNAQGLECATSLAIEIGYYESDLPIRLRHTLEEADRIGKKPKNDDDRMRWFFFKGSLIFNSLNESLRQRNEEILLPYTYGWFKGEKVLQTVIDDVHIPYQYEDDLSIRRYPPDFTRCARIEIQYQPSMLEYFFPYPSQQSLLSPKERKYLQSENNILVQKQKDITMFVNNIKNGIPTGGLVREQTTARVVCYYDDQPRTYFAIYNDHSLVIDLKDRFTYNAGFPSLRTITPHIKEFELRIQCSANLRNLWHRLRLYYKASGVIEMLYPTPTEWCDSMTQAYDDKKDTLDLFIKSPHICPSAGEGKNHYALNPNCKPDSPPYMVLLFETKAGWNQHGGPELFTFDNHDPKGGCVLLNDGTVKFTRTKEELQQLRWK
jgi:hypothetical protein